MQIKQELQNTIKQVVKELYSLNVEPVIERPAVEEHGDYSTNIAMVLAGQLKRKPLEIAGELKGKLRITNYELQIEVANPGFLNFTFEDSILLNSLKEIISTGEKYGNSGLGKGRKVNVEFVSANPTGPLHIGNFRGGPLGDVIAAVLEKVGYEITREYYHNDLGEQVRKLGESILYWQKKAAGEEYAFPEGGYEGEYIKSLSATLSSKVKIQNSKKIQKPKANGEKPEELGKQAVEVYFHQALEISKQVGINFDVVSKESEIKEKGKTQEALEILKKKGYLKEKEGAVWFAKEDEHLGDRECVVIKSNGEPTYFGNDLGYHLDKYERGFDKVIDIWGANHSGHVARMKSAMDALGFGADWLELPLYQWVSVLRSGKPVAMSKRKGNFVTAKEVLDEVGKDALRWFFLSRDANTHIQFDLDLAKEQSKKNPVYYVQYAYARIFSLMKKSGINNYELRITSKTCQITSEERSLIRELLYFPQLIEELAETLAVHKLTLYATKLADKFHKFYENCQVIGSKQESQRLAILKSTQTVLLNTFSLLGVSAPEKM